MLDYNDNNIVVGYIKQLLTSFNYLGIDVFSSNIIPIKDNYYLYNNKIIKYDGNDPEFSSVIFNYRDNKFILNITKNFNNKSFIYDYETHIWLGRYLRWLRDYNNLDLMSMYNCFTDKLASNVNISSNNYTFNSNDSNYNIYSIPVKLFNEYNLYIEENSNVEIICTFNKSSSNEYEEPLRRLTYKKIGSPLFRTPIRIDALTIKKLQTNSSYLEGFYNNKDTLTLLIKVPASNTSSIVLLEGNYNNYNDFILSTTEEDKQNHYLMKFNSSVNNYEYIEDGKLNKKLISPLELLSINTGKSHPFANRLIEYLTELAITPLDETQDNIKRIQSILKERYYNMDGDKHNQLGMKSYGNNYGIWIDRMTNTLYDIEVSNNRLGDIKDIKGYVDKDVEVFLGEDIDIYGGNDL